MRTRTDAIRIAVVTLPIIGLSTGCPPRHVEPTAHSDEPEQRTASETVWTDRFEVFWEHRPFVVNLPRTVACHVTELETGEARRVGPLHLTATPEKGAPIELTEKEVARAGIYQPKLVFPSTGTWKIVLRFPTEKGEATVELPPERVFSSMEEGQKALPEEGGEAGISFLKEQQWKVLTKSEPATKRRLSEHLRLPAHVEARPGSRARVTPPVAGRLLAAGRPFPTIGERVEAGVVVARVARVQPPLNELVVRLAEAETNVARTKLAAEQSERAAARIRKLAVQQAKSERELEEAEAALSSAKAAYDSAVQVEAAWKKAATMFIEQGGVAPVLDVVAPISGVVVDVEATLGEQVGPEKELLTILDASKVLIEAHVAEADLARISTGALVAAYRDPRGPLVPISEPKGKLVLRGLEVDVTTHTFPLVFLVENDGLPIGLAIDVLLETGRADEALCVPESAIVEEEGRPIVFVHESGENFLKRSVQLGLREDGFVQIINGVSEGERVVTKEAYALRLASVSNVIPAHGHAH